jgi:hypothetical protein
MQSRSQTPQTPVSRTQTPQSRLQTAQSISRPGSSYRPYTLADYHSQQLRDQTMVLPQSLGPRMDPAWKIEVFLTHLAR